MNLQVSQHTDYANKVLRKEIIFLFFYFCLLERHREHLYLLKEHTGLKHSMVVSSTIQFKASFLEQQGQIFNSKLQFNHSKVLFDEQDLNFNPRA